MQTKKTGHYDCLSPYTRESGTGGPTSTFTAQRRFAQRLRGVLSRINAAIRKGVVENDIFNLSEASDTLEVDEPGPFQTDDSARMTAMFMAWLREQLNTEFLEVVGPDRNQFIEKAYLAGIRNVNSQLRDLDISFVPEGATSVVDRPIHQSALRELFTRTYENLESVASDVATEVRDELLSGFQEGKGPNDIARSLTDRVDSIGKNRSTLIARSELINAHSTGSLNTIDEVQEDKPDEPSLTVAHGEWDAANDSRTCPFCMALDGVQMSTEEMRGGVVNVVGELPGEVSQLGQSFRLKPPAHPNGRCNIRVMVGSEAEGSLEDRLPEQLEVA